MPCFHDPYSCACPQLTYKCTICLIPQSQTNTQIYVIPQWIQVGLDKNLGFKILNIGMNTTFRSLCTNKHFLFNLLVSKFKRSDSFHCSSVWFGVTQYLKLNFYAAKLNKSIGNWEVYGIQLQFYTNPAPKGYGKMMHIYFYLYK